MNGGSSLLNPKPEGEKVNHFLCIVSSDILIREENSIILLCFKSDKQRKLSDESICLLL